MALDGLRFGEKFSRFNIVQTTYKKVEGHEIRADLIVPKSLGPRKSPVIARFHGGGLSCGDSLHEPWFPKWLLELAESSSAVIISANYRLLPEARGLDVLDDVDDFWEWLHSPDLAAFLESVSASSLSSIELDLGRIITAGDSAGGLLSVYLALSHPDEIRSATAAYPALHWDDPPMFPTPKIHVPPPQTGPHTVIETHLAKVAEVASSDPTLARLALSAAISQEHRGPEFYFRGATESTRQERLSQLSRLDRPDARLPRGGLVIHHGEDDILVLVGASERFVNKARRVLRDRQGADRIVLALRPGPHGFDVNASIKEGWLESALKTAVKTWLE